MQNWLLQQLNLRLHLHKPSSYLISLLPSQPRVRQLMHQRQSLYSKLLANLFVPVRDIPAKEKAVRLKALLQQPRHNQNGPDRYQPCNLPQPQLLSLAQWRKRQRHCQLFPHKFHQRKSCEVHLRSADIISSYAAVSTTWKYSFIASSFITHKKKPFLSVYFLICVVFSHVFHVIVNLRAFAMYACEDTSTLKFGGVVFPNACVYVYVCVVCCVLCVVWSSVI